MCEMKEKIYIYTYIQLLFNLNFFRKKKGMKPSRQKDISSFKGKLTFKKKTVSDDCAPDFTHQCSVKIA